MSEAGERLIRSAKQAQAIARGPAPDIREKAERLAAGIEDEGTTDNAWINERGIALISQALLEAHNAGREEMREDITETIEQMMLDTKAIREQGPADMVRATRVISKLLDGYVAIAKLLDATAIRSIT